MLELRRIKKSYKTGDFVQDALKSVYITFRKSEFVAVLGQSGSGKTTLLNIIGGLDRYNRGDMILNKQSTKRFSDKQWDAYRNNCVGFIFQSYNLITHISVLANVEMGMTLSGISLQERRTKAKAALDRVGLMDHTHKNPNQLSGGQMQRVAIARALANDPDIILADEPTGALDSNTSIQIMELIKEISKDKLVIMVTHNPELANKYANRLITLQDGSLQSDSNPINRGAEKDNAFFEIKKTSMSYYSALKLSFNNILTKKARTILTSFASSFGIIGIALILSMSNGFQIQIAKYEKDSLSQMPISISEQESSLDVMQLATPPERVLEKYTSEHRITSQKNNNPSHKNIITQDYIDYVEAIDPNDLSSITMHNSVILNVLVQSDNNVYNKADLSTSSWYEAPTNAKDSLNQGVLESNFDVLQGSINQNEPGIIVTVDAFNQVEEVYLKQLGFDKQEDVSFDDIMNKQVKVILNDDFYTKAGPYFSQNQNYKEMYNSDKSITVKVQAIIRGKKDKEILTSDSCISYTDSLIDQLIEGNKNSSIIKEQKKVDYNILTGQPFEATSNSTNSKDAMLGALGADPTPYAISIYPVDFDAKDRILAYLNAYNMDKSEEANIQYTDYAEMISSLSGNIMDAIVLVLIAFSAISLVVSSIMIGIITYISVLERTKEIGILRALGARKKDITRVFNAETMIIGICSGLLGVGIALALTMPANALVYEMSGLENVAQLKVEHAATLIIISILLTLIGGYLPAKFAARKDPVEALRSE